MSDSALATRPERPKKPSKDFPLFPHLCGYWAKKVRGRTRYFGKWSDPQAALTLWLAQRDDLLAGREPAPVAADELLLKDLCNHYLTAKHESMERGEITPRTFSEYLAACKRVARVVGSGTPVGRLMREDFTRLRADMGKTLGPVAVTNEIRRCRMIFTWGVGQNMLDHLPTYGDGMRRPSAKTMRKHRSAQGLRMFEAEQLRGILEHAGPTLRAMILLGINCAFGNTDLARLERPRLDLRKGWVDYPRPKTGVPRRCPLWPETRRAVKKVLRSRDRRLAGDEDAAAAPAATEGTEKPKRRRRHGRLVFLTKYGRPWTAKTGSPLSSQFGRLVRRCGYWRRGVNFYALRHTFETIAGDTKDQPAIDFIMGHTSKASDMSAVYRERIDDERLQAVAEHVRKWLFGEAGG